MSYRPTFIWPSCGACGCRTHEFSMILLVDQGWKQRISHFPHSYQLRVDPFIQNEDENVSSVLCLCVCPHRRGKLELNVAQQVPASHATPSSSHGPVQRWGVPSRTLVYPMEELPHGPLEA